MLNTFILFHKTRIIIIMVVTTRTTLITGTIITTRFALPWPVSFPGKPKKKCKLYRFSITFKIDKSPRLVYYIHPKFLQYIQKIVQCKYHIMTCYFTDDFIIMFLVNQQDSLSSRHESWLKKRGYISIF